MIRVNSIIDLIDSLKTTKNSDFEKDIVRVQKYSRGSYTTNYSTLMSSSTTMDRSDDVEKFDSTTDNASSQTANNFAQAILPRGVESVRVKIDVNFDDIRLNQDVFNQIIVGAEKTLTEMLQDNLKVCGFKAMVKNCARDFIDYGNACAEIFYNSFGNIQCSKCSFEDVYFQSYSRIGCNLMMFISKLPEYAIKFLYPEYSATTTKGRINKDVKKITYLYIDKFYNDMLLSSMSKAEIEKISRTFKPIKGDYYIIVVDDKSNVIYYGGLKYKPFYFATIDDSAGNGYGKGDGLNTMGSILQANLSSGSKMVSTQKINNPNYLKASQCVLTPADEELAEYKDIIDPRAGAITNIADGDGSNSTLTVPMSNYIQPASDPGKQLQEFINIHNEAKLEVKEGYQTSAYVPGEPVPGESIPMTISRLGLSIRSFRSKSDYFNDDLIIPICETILKQTVPTKTMNLHLEEAIGQYDIGGKFKVEYRVVIDSMLNEQENNIKKTNFERKMQMMGNIMQFANPEEEGGGATFQNMMLEANKVYED